VRAVVAHKSVDDLSEGRLRGITRIRYENVSTGGDDAGVYV
jgi:hypothetical protein